MADRPAEYNPWDGSYSAFIGKGVIVFAALKMATQYLGVWFNSKPVDFKVKYLHDGVVKWRMDILMRSIKRTQTYRRGFQ